MGHSNSNISRDFLTRSGEGTVTGSGRMLSDQVLANIAKFGRLELSVTLETGQRVNHNRPIMIIEARSTEPDHPIVSEFILLFS